MDLKLAEVSPLNEKTQLGSDHFYFKRKRRCGSTAVWLKALFEKGPSRTNAIHQIPKAWSFRSW